MALNSARGSLGPSRRFAVVGVAPIRRAIRCGWGLGGVAPIRWPIRWSCCGADSLWFRFAGVGGIGELLILAPLWPVARVASPPWPADQRL